MKNIIEQLLYEEESQTLDFKAEQYRFQSASDHEKSELLKDVLGFANAWRRADAYILIGLRDVKGGRAEVVGIDQHFDDAQLQQFVNTKTQRPIDFCYRACEFEGKQVGVIRIGPQDRPIYLTKDFGKIRKNEVIIRRGSSTETATPDEIAKMGKHERLLGLDEPELVLNFAEATTTNSLGIKHQINTTVLEIADEIPDFVEPRKRWEPLSIVNKDYYRQIAMYFKRKLSVAEVSFLIRNEGTAVANDINIELHFRNDGNLLEVYDETFLPSIPKRYRFGVDMPSFVNIQNQPKVTMLDQEIVVLLKVEKVQPKQVIVLEHKLLVGAKGSMSSYIDVFIFCDSLKNPIRSTLQLEIEAVTKPITGEMVVQLTRRRKS